MIGLHVTTLGCKLNQLDSAELAGVLRGTAGLRGAVAPVADPASARLIVVSGGRAEEPEDFESWLNSVSGTFDTGGMTTDEYMEWLRGPRDDLGSR